MGKVRDLLGQILKAVERCAPKPDAFDPIEPAPQLQPGGAAQEDAASVPPGGGVRLAGRGDVLRELSRIADFFRRTEPHSPLAYTLDEAVRRGRMSLPDLLVELVPDVAVRNAMLGSLGIKRPE